MKVRWLERMHRLELGEVLKAARHSRSAWFCIGSNMRKLRFSRGTIHDTAIVELRANKRSTWYKDVTGSAVQLLGRCEQQHAEGSAPSHTFL